MIGVEVFGVLADGRVVDAYTLSNTSGVRVQILTLGGIVRSFVAPDRAGVLDDLVLGYDDLESYAADDAYFGALIGRFANRIARGRFVLEGRTYQLTRNDGRNTLHGGTSGFDKAIWSASQRGANLILSHHSPDGDQGFPGALDVAARYALSEAGMLSLDFTATTTAPTVLNLTNHTYWNLAGHAGADVQDHTLSIDADAFAVIDAEMISTGIVQEVSGTIFDLRAPRRVGEILRSGAPQIVGAGGIDCAYVLNAAGKRAARLADSGSGRRMEIVTSEPCLQVYVGQAAARARKGGRGGRRWSGVALETQHFPDSPNHPAFPTTILRPGEIYRSSTTFRVDAGDVGTDREARV